MQKKEKGQVSIFVILAIVLAAGIIIFFIVRNTTISTAPPKNIQPVYEHYLSCLKNEISNGAFLLGQRAGYIEQPDFEQGSEFMPFSNYLDFLGTGIPYWYYISGNNLVKEQIPSKEKMQEQLNNFLEERIQDCNFQEYEDKGFVITFEQPDVKTKISDAKITAEVKQPLTISFENKTWASKTHEAEAKTQLGEFYNLAKKIYSNNEKTMFLENYALDILRLNAPVDGSEISCSTKIWQVNQIRENLIQALQTNIPFTKLKGDYYRLSKTENKYFVHDLGEDISTNINFMFLPEWPVKIEIWPNENEILKANPVGLQEGLGILGFCYVPYHFVYDFSYPVLIQIYSGEEIFQFPVVVSVDKNQPRKSESAESLPDVVPELCIHKNTQFTISTYNSELQPINADIQFKCFDTSCDIGTSENGKLTADFPQCANGYLIASAEGYETEKQLLSTIEPSSATIILNKEYQIPVELTKAQAQLQDEYAVLTFSRISPEQVQEKTATIAYPEQTKITLTEGYYKITAYVYSESEITLPSSKIQKCTEIPKTGIWSLFGMKEEKCFAIDMPEQLVSFAVAGGGKTSLFISESELKSADKITINTASFTKPSTPEQLQENYNNVELSSLEVEIK